VLQFDAHRVDVYQLLRLGLADTGSSTGLCVDMAGTLAKRPSVLVDTAQSSARRTRDVGGGA